VAWHASRTLEPVGSEFVLEFNAKQQQSQQTLALPWINLLPHQPGLNSLPVVVSPSDHLATANLQTTTRRKVHRTLVALPAIQSVSVVSTLCSATRIVHVDLVAPLSFS